MNCNFHEYQIHAIDYIIKNKKCALFLEMGLGKTLITLTAIKKLKEEGKINKVLIVAPLRVSQYVWSDEIDKWEHLKGLRISKILGTRIQRIRALEQESDIYIINRDNFVWIVDYVKVKDWKFDMVVVDESSSFKNGLSKRFKAFKIIIDRLDRTVLLTGTPTPNGLLDLWSQMYMLDKGKALGKFFTHFRKRYFHSTKYINGREVDWKVDDGADNVVFDIIKHLCMSMRTEDYMKLPDKVIVPTIVKMDDKEKDLYNKFEKDLVINLLDDTTICADNRGALCIKLLQMANGNVYDEDKNINFIHDKKIKALLEILETDPGNVIIFYSFKHDKVAIEKMLIENEYSFSCLENKEDIINWNKGLIQVLLLHPASAGHGLNLQGGGNVIIYYGLTWSLDYWLQSIARLHRQGQVKPVFVYPIICDGTVDNVVMNALSNKESTQDGLLDAVKGFVLKKCL